MKIPVKKLKNGFGMPVYGLGLWEIGGRWEADTSRDKDEISSIKYAIETGVTAIDTAEVYGNGHAEELLANAIRGFDRKKLFISTKVFATNQGYHGTLNAFDNSKKRLGLEYIDLYLLHSFPSPGISLPETMRALDELVKYGQIKNIGVCNLTPERFDLVQKHTKNKLVYNQVHYNLQFREPEHYKLQQHAVENDYFLAAWRPVQKGRLPESEIVKELAQKYAKTPVQIAINWLVSQQNIITLSKTSAYDHLLENLGALDWKMQPKDIERLRKEFPGQESRSDAVPLDYKGSDG